MPTYERLTDRTLATGVTLTDFIHIVITGDTSQNVAGSSYKATIQQIADTITGVTGSSGTSGTNGTSGSSGSSGISGLGLFLPLSGGTVTGETIVQSGLTANTLNISSTPSTDTSFSVEYLTRDSSSGDVKMKTAAGPINYGLFSQTGDSTVISATTSELTLIDGGIGSLTVPANGFNVGDSFRVVMGGMMSSANGETLTLRVKSGSVIFVDSGPQSLPTVNNDVWVLNVNFTIRSIGGTGVASIVTLGTFSYTKTAGGTQEGFSFNTVNNTTFDTTISNTLDITAEWGSTNASNSISSDFFNLNNAF